MPRLACSLDTTLARHARAFGALGEPAHASCLESALVRVGRWEEAYLLRWRRGEPSLVAGALVDAQRATLAALAADPVLRLVPCDLCGPYGCGRSFLEVAAGASRAALGWSPLAAGVALPDAPVVGARGVRRPVELAALRTLDTIAVLELTSTALQSDESLPPTTESLRVHLGDEDEGRLDPRHVAGLEGLRSLQLWGRLTDDRLDGVLEACGGRLERLRVDAELLTDVGLEALTRAPRLRELALERAPWLDGSCLRALVEVGAPLRRFSLRNAPRSTWRTLDAVGSLETVEEIEMEGVAFDDDGLDALAALPGIRRVTLTQSGVGPGAFDDLVDAPVEHIEIRTVSGVDDLALQTFAASSTLRKLTLFAISEPTRRGWTALACAPRLERLSLDRCSIDTEALVALARSTSIVDLMLGDIGDGPAADGCAVIGRMPRLARLSLAGPFSAPLVLDALADAATRVTALELAPRWQLTSVSHLAPIARFPRLQRLTVATRTAPGAIASLAGAPNLEELTLSTTTTVDDAELAALRACLPLRSLRLRCDEPTRLRIAEALPGVEVLSLNPWSRSPIAES